MLVIIRDYCHYTQQYYAAGKWVSEYPDAVRYTKKLAFNICKVLNKTGADVLAVKDYGLLTEKVIIDKGGYINGNGD